MKSIGTARSSNSHETPVSKQDQSGLIQALLGGIEFGITLAPWPPWVQPIIRNLTTPVTQTLSTTRTTPRHNQPASSWSDSTTSRRKFGPNESGEQELVDLNEKYELSYPRNGALINKQSNLDCIRREILENLKDSRNILINSTFLILHEIGEKLNDLYSLRIAGKLNAAEFLQGAQFLENDIEQAYENGRIFKAERDLAISDLAVQRKHLGND